MFEQIHLVAGRRGAEGEDNFHNKLERFSVHAGKNDKILVAHVQRICEAHYTVIQSTVFGKPRILFALLVDRDTVQKRNCT